MRPTARRPRDVLRSLAIVVTLCAVVTACTATGGPSSPVALPPIDLGPGWTWTPQADRLELGVTHSQRSVDLNENAAARERGTRILAENGSTWQNQHLMGFGTLNPEPAPGAYDWASLDARMALIRNTGGRTVLTACCAPDWMKGGRPGTTDWSTIETAPTREFFDDYARLTAAAVKRYPQIERVLVWNELKGFFDAGKNRWNYEGYTEFYNTVYRAVKQVRPDVQVGGPYISINGVSPGSPFASTELVGRWGAADRRVLDVVTYWLANNQGADFVAIDGPTIARDGTLPADVTLGAQKFADSTAWVRSKAARLPIWWAEFYANVPAGADAGPETAASAVSTLAAIGAYAESGVSVALLWGPEGAPGLDYSALWTSAEEPDGGAPTALTDPWRWLAPRLASGKVEVGRPAGLPLLAFRAPDGVLVVNTSGDDVTPPGLPDATLPGWGVTIQERPAG